MLVRVRQKRFANALDRLATAILLIDLALRIQPQWPVILGKDGHFGMGLVELLERIANGLSAATPFFRAKRFVTSAGQAPRPGQPPRADDDRRAFGFAQLG